MDLRKIVKNLAILFGKALLVCNIIVLFNVVFVSLFWPSNPNPLYSVALFTLLEGGIGLTIGGLFVIGSGPTFTKVSEKVLHGQPYSAKRARESEAKARLFFFLSALLIVIGFLLGM